MLSFYNTGTVSVANGATTVTGTGVLWSGLLAGDTLELAGQRVTIGSVTDATHFELATAWSGANQAGASYLVRFDAPSRFTSGYLAEQVRALIAQAGIIKAARPNYEVQSLGSNTPPGSPVTGDMYVVGTVPTGAWVGQANSLAQRTVSGWLFTAPARGTTVVSVATGTVSIWNGTAWLPYVAPSAFIQTLMDDADAATARTTLGAQAALGYTPVNKAGDTMGGRLVAAGGGQGNNGIANAAGNLGEIEVRGNGTGAAAQLFHRPAGFAAYLGLDTDNQWKVGGGSYGAVAYKIYHAASIIGAVSQAGGVPTGAIVERGSNGNGEYVRFADGTQICWRRHLRAPGVIAAGATVALGSYVFPVAFSAPPVVTSSYDGGWAPYIISSIQTVTAASIGGASFTNVSSVSRDTTGTDPTFHYIAIGRWF